MAPLSRNLTGAVLAAAVLVSCGDSEASKRRLLEAGNKYYQSGKYREASIIYSKVIQKDPKYGEAYYSLSLNEIKAGRYGDALRALRRASELQPENEDAHTRLGDLYLALYLSDPARFKQFLTEMEQLADKLLRANPSSYTAIRMRGFQMSAQGNYSEAVSYFRRAIALKDADPALRLGLVQAINANGQPELAEQTAREFIAKDKSYGPLYDFIYVLKIGGKQVDEAEKILLQKLNNNPKAELYYVDLSLHYMRNGQREKMEAALTHLIDNSKDFPRGPMIAGDFYLRSAFFQLSEAAYRKGLESRPGDRRIYEKKLVELMLTQGRKQEAVQLADKLLGEDKDDPEARALRAMLRLQGATPQELAAATAELEAVMSRMSENPVVRFNLAEAYLATGKIDQAVVQLQEALRMRPNYLPAKLVLARIYLEKKDYPRALAVADDVLRILPRSQHGRMIRIAALLGQRDLKNARSEVNAVLSFQPDLPDAVFLSAMIDLLEQKFPDAERGFRRLMQVAPQDTRGIRGLVETLLATNRNQQAMDTLELELKKTNDPRAIRLTIATVAIRQKDYGRATSELQTLLKQSPDSPDLLLRLGGVYRQSGRFEEAMQFFRKARELNPNDPYPLLEMALFYDQTGKRQEAKPIYEEILRLSPDNPVALNNLAYLMADTWQELDQALTYAQLARQRMPENEDIADTLGWIYIKKNLSDEAIQIFRNLLVKRPDHVTWRYHLAMALFQKGDRIQAKRELEMALKGKPTADEDGKIRSLLARIG